MRLTNGIRPEFRIQPGEVRITDEDILAALLYPHAPDQPETSAR